MADFKRLSDVEVVAEPTESAKVLIEEKGVIKRTPKNKIGGIQSDWNENNPDVDSYIFNRPFYTTDPVDTEVVNLEDTYFIPYSEEDTVFCNGLILAENTTCKIIFDGVEYVCETYVSENYGICLGDETIPANRQIGEKEPFFIQSDGEWGSKIFADGIHSIKVIVGVCDDIKIPEKYLPKTATPIFDAYNENRLVEELHLMSIDYNADLQPVFISGTQLFVQPYEERFRFSWGSKWSKEELPVDLNVCVTDNSATYRSKKPFFAARYSYMMEGAINGLSFVIPAQASELEDGGWAVTGIYECDAKFYRLQIITHATSPDASDTHYNVEHTVQRIL